MKYIKRNHSPANLSGIAKFNPLTRALPTLSLEGEGMLRNPSPLREKVAPRAG